MAAHKIAALLDPPDYGALPEQIHHVIHDELWVLDADQLARAKLVITRDALRMISRNVGTPKQTVPYVTHSIRQMCRRYITKTKQFAGETL